MTYGVGISVPSEMLPSVGCRNLGTVGTLGSVLYLAHVPRRGEGDGHQHGCRLVPASLLPPCCLWPTPLGGTSRVILEETSAGISWQLP